MGQSEYLSYICNFVFSSGWEDYNAKEQIRALFISYCLIFNIDVDTYICDLSLKNIYEAGHLEELVNYEEYERFMIQDIV